MRHTIVHQLDSSDCGPACLSMIAAHYGKRQSVAQLREKAGTDRQGTNLAGLVRAATEVGFRARAVRATSKGLPELPLPAIAHWSEQGRNHFVVIFRRSRNRITVGDPALGLRRLTPPEFERHWTGVLVLLEPTPDLKDLSSPSLLKLWPLIRHHRKIFLDALLAAVLMTILGLSSSFFIQLLVDFVFPLGRGHTLNWLGAGMLVLLLARVAFLSLRAYLLAHLSQRIDATIALAYHHHLLGLPLSFFLTRRTGEIVSRLNDAARIRTALGGTSLAILVDTTMVALTASVMFWLHWKLSLMSLALLPLLVFLVWALSSPMKRAQRRAVERSALFEAHTIEAIGSIEALKAFRAEARMRFRGEARLMEALEAGFEAQMYALYSSTATALLTGLSGLGLLWVGGHAVLNGELTAGQLMALYTMLGAMLGPIERLATANQSIQDALVAGERLGEVFQIEPERKHERTVRVEGPIRGSIDFSRVSFRYGCRPPIIRDFSLSIAPGECCRIAGASGTGKSTLVRLLGRFIEPECGSVRIDGIDVREYDFDVLRRQVAFVSQEANLLSATIADNIRLGRPDADAGAIQHAARQSGAAEFVEQLPLGYDSVVGERGLNLSGGERQRLALARAILLDPPVLVLDEPENHLDQTSFTALRKLIEQRRRERRTTILISHNSVPADRTILMEDHAVGVAN